MKKITEMTHDEIIKLEDEQIEKMIRYQCAEEGVVFLDAPTTPNRPNINFDSKIYTLDSFASYDLDFLYKLQSLIVENLSKLRKLDYDWQVGSEYKYPQPLRSCDIEAFSEVKTQRCLSESYYETIKSSLQDYKKEKESYDKQKVLWEKAQSSYNEIRSEIRTIWNDALYKEHEIQNHKKRFQEYLGIADNDEQKAIAFYLKAYSLTDDMKQRVFPEFREV